MSIHLTDYHDAVKKHILEKTKWLRSFTEYPETSTALQTPCAFFQIEDFERAETQRMNGTLAVDLSCEIIVVLGIDDPSNQLEVRNAAMSLAMQVDGSRFGLACDEARFVSAAPDALHEELDGYAAWSIRFSHRIEVGKDEYKPDFDDVIPHTVHVGFAPEIGAGHEEEYEQIIPINEIEPR